MVCLEYCFALMYHTDKEIRKSSSVNCFSVATGFWKLHLLVNLQPAGYNGWIQRYQWHRNNEYSDFWALCSELWLRHRHLLDRDMYYALSRQYWQDWKYFGELQVTACNI